MVFQSYALFPHLSVAENIVFGLKVRKVSAADRVRGLHARRISSALRNFSTADHRSCRAASSSASRWDVRS